MECRVLLLCAVILFLMPHSEASSEKGFKEDEWKLLEFASLIAHDGYDAVRQFVEGLKYEQNPQKMLSKFVNFLQAEAAAFKKYYKADQVERKVTTIKQLMQPATHLYVKRYYGDFLSYEHHILLTGAEYYEDDQELVLDFIHYTQVAGSCLLKEHCGVVESEFLNLTISQKFLYRPISKQRLRVNEDSAGIAEDLMNGDLYSVEHPDYPENKKERHAAVRRAENRLGEKSYNIFINNCETFVTEVLMPGYGHSKQVHKVAAVSASASASASAATLSFTSLGPATAKFMKTASPVFVDAFSSIISSIPEAESVLDIVEKLLEARSLKV